MGSAETVEASVLRCRDLEPGSLERVMACFCIEVRWVAEGRTIPGSHWGEPEAGIRGNRLFVRPDTPLHSALHEGGHLAVMDAERRRGTETDAGGDELEESAVCYLQVLLADSLAGVGRERLMRDMDAWGYSFRLLSTRRWFEEDAEDARAWLVRRGLIDQE